MTAIKDVQPDVGFPRIRVETLQNSHHKERKQDRSPATKAILKGKSEKLRIPSIE